MTAVAAVAVAVALAANAGGQTFADEPVLTLRAELGAGTADAPLTIELFRWSTDAEREPLLTALSAPPQAAAPADGRGAGRAAGRGGRGGRAAGPPPTPIARLTSAAKAAPTVGFIWRDGPTGYSIKYAWRSESPDGQERIVLLTDRRVGARSAAAPASSGAAADADFTVIEIRIDGKGIGEGKMSPSGAVVVDAAAGTLALDGSAAAPALLEVTR